MLGSFDKTLTAQQRAAVAIAPRPGVALITAIAGSGKTTTLRAYAEAHPRVKTLYLCFNKAQADEAKATFLRNATCRTTHALAFGQTGYQYMENRAKPFGLELRTKSVMAVLRISHVETAQIVLRTLTNFLQSAQVAVDYNHLPSYARDHALDERNQLLKLVHTLWTRMVDPLDSSMPIPHDGYLKLWQIEVLQGRGVPPVLAQYDAILIDESQDINPAFEAIIYRLIQEKKHALIMVGDERQAIYQWRGAVNMMQRLGDEIRKGALSGQILTLSESFRYGPRTANLATKILAVGHQEEDPPTLQIVGHGSDNPNASGSHCYLARTNSALVAQALALAQNGSGHIHFAATRAQDGWSPQVAYKFPFLLSAYGQYVGQRGLITDPEILRFANWNEILSHTKPAQSVAEAVDLELAAAVKFVEKFRHEVPTILRQLSARCGPPEGAQTTISTVHRAKGLEWDSITLLEDFPHLYDAGNGNGNSDYRIPTTAELNLLYVAVTRGRQWVHLNADLERFLAHGGPSV